MENARESGSTSVFKHVVEMIVSKKILPGDILYETAIAEDIGLSRTPVREAFTRLVARGFLKQIRGRRGYLLPPLTSDDMRDVFHARECIEQKVAFLAAQNATKSDVDMLIRLNAEEEDTSLPLQAATTNLYNRGGESYGSVDVNVKFHLAIADMSENEYLKDFYEMIYWRSHLYTHYIINFMSLSPDSEHIFLNRKRANTVAFEHASITKAISNRDCELAATAAVNHIKNTTAYAIAFSQIDIFGEIEQ